MNYKFNPENKNSLNNEERRTKLPPEKTLETLMLKEGDDVADIGCGIGYFTIPAAKIVTNNGMVYAVDVEKEMLNTLQEKIEEEDIDNIKIIKSQEYVVSIKENTV